MIYTHKRINMHIPTGCKHFSFYVEHYCDKIQLVSWSNYCSTAGDILNRSTSPHVWAFVYTLGLLEETHSCLLCDSAPANLLGRDLLWKKNCLIKGTWKIILGNSRGISRRSVSQSCDRYIWLFWTFPTMTLVLPDHLWDKYCSNIGCIMEVDPIKIQTGLSKPLPRLLPWS